jgi:hypothetical protein
MAVGEKPVIMKQRCPRRVLERCIERSIGVNSAPPMAGAGETPALTGNRPAMMPLHLHGPERPIGMPEVIAENTGALPDAWKNSTKAIASTAGIWLENNCVAYGRLVIHAKGSVIYVYAMGDAVSRSMKARGPDSGARNLAELRKAG